MTLPTGRFLLDCQGFSHFGQGGGSDSSYLEQIVHPVKRPVPVAIGHDPTRHVRPDSGETLEGRGVRRIDVDGRAARNQGFDRWSFRKPNMGREDCQKTRTDSRHSIEPLKTPERPTGIAIGFNGFGQGASDSRQPGDVIHRGLIQIDLLSGRERPVQGHGSLSLSRERLTGVRRKKDQATRCSIGTVPPDPNALPHEGEPQQEKDGATLRAHGPR
jgi:hypothetical protein